MSPNLLKILIAGVFFVHGIGHIMGLLPIMGVASTDTWTADSWLLTGLLGSSISRAIGFVLFLLAFLGFAGAALAVMGWLVPHELWRSLAVWSAVISLVAIFLFWNAFVAFFPNKVGAVAVNAATLAALLWMNWPTEAAIGY